MSWYGDWAPYVPVSTKIARGHAAAKKLAAKEGRNPCPVTIAGRKIAKTFWGLKWCENLERYRDISNRLPRGATYVRNGSVADLVIEPGRVRAIVGGSEAYEIEITIKTLKPDVWQSIGRDCAQEIESLFDLLQGRFSTGVMQRLTQPDCGLFPHSSEITMSCSCPDYAGVCKHIAATFYGVAARLDVQPELLFKLRNVDHLELIGHATNVANLDRVLGSTNGTTLADSDLGDIFGIDMETSETPTTPGRKPRRPVQRKTKVTVPSEPTNNDVVQSAARTRKRQSTATPDSQGSVSRSNKPVVKTSRSVIAKKPARKLVKNMTHVDAAPSAKKIAIAPDVAPAKTHRPTKRTSVARTTMAMGSMTRASKTSADKGPASKPAATKSSRAAKAKSEPILSVREAIESHSRPSTARKNKSTRKREKKPAQSPPEN